jgi:membrane-associated phospholipid phosphatase
VTKPGKLSAAAISAGLSLLFIVVYGSCNWLSAQRSDVGTWYYAWERYIPFISWMIAPYMSIDLFFVAAPFLCGSNPELRTLARRIVFAILVAGAFFLLMPLTVAVPRPQPGDWTAPIFKFLHGFDQPHNLFPSLHITLRTILAALYARHARGLLRAASHVWFSLIGFSTLLTYQHHFADIVGGFVLATICFYLFREDQRLLPVIPNYGVGSYYAGASAIATAVAYVFWPYTAILLWPALALTITAAAYFGLGPVIYRKSDGRLPLSAKLLLAPCLIGQHLSLLYYRRQSAAWNQVVPGVWIGAKLPDHEAILARRTGVTAVLDLTAEFSEARPFLELPYLNLPVLDLTQLTPEYLRTAADFIAEHSRHGIVYVHCKIGYSRSAAAIGAFLLKSGLASSPTECCNLFRSTRPGLILRKEVETAWDAFSRALPCSSAVATSGS